MLPPRLPERPLPREDLVRRAADGLARRLLAIVASAGYGKSTLLAQALERSPHPWVWLACDERMGASAALVGHLAAGISQRFPGFGARLSLAGGPDAQVAELCNEILAAVPEDLVIAVDDAHAVAGSPAGEALRLLVRDLPPHAHLAIASRSALPIALSRLRAAGQLVELGEADLALSAEESGELLATRGVELPDKTVRELHRLTEGWITGIVLAAQAGGVAPRADAPGTAAHLFDFMAEEVFHRQPKALQDFLLGTAVLDRFSPAVASAVTGADARVRIAELTARHLFILRLDPEGSAFRYHHLFAEFLRRRLADAGVDLRRQHHRAADAWREAGSPVGAGRRLRSCTRSRQPAVPRFRSPDPGRQHPRRCCRGGGGAVPAAG